MPFLRPIWTFFGTPAPGIEVMVTLRDPDQARCRLACRSCRTRGRKERALSSPTFAPSPSGKQLVYRSRRCGWRRQSYRGQERVAKSPVPDTACQSPHRRNVRRGISVNDGPGCRLHPLQRLCQTHRRTPSVPW